MRVNNIAELEEKYDLELDRIILSINKIKKKNPKVLLQFPDGLKQYALDIVDYLEFRTKAEFIIFLGSCFGACDIPSSDADLLVQFGHASWV